ncbi:PilZ domain-containing protein [Rhodopseudomonas sp. HC1]|uniref:PilZ domain-containing protein n=1 Tax=Rhodopseudomonas infernalis TaxID=2897386 RepID=UPI001EE8AE99|nr:PilZ domain-containing protein [Rhodopseudomonas infernalis]MCG6204561.1 PilZ domain-containing protein [Rhodopseudomonas infernalis]
MTERRSVPRQRVYKRGTVAFNSAGFECTVRNLSASGARIDLEGPVGLPEHFMLVIESDKVMHRCRPVWSSAQRVGVAFE